MEILIFRSENFCKSCSFSHISLVMDASISIMAP